MVPEATNASATARARNGAAPRVIPVPGLTEPAAVTPNRLPTRYRSDLAYEGLYANLICSGGGAARSLWVAGEPPHLLGDTAAFLQPVPHGLLRWGAVQAYWLGEGSPLLAGDRYALLQPGGRTLVRRGGYLCEVDPEAAAATLVATGAQHCAVVSARTAEGDEQSVAVDLPELSAWDPPSLRQKVVARLQAGNDVVLTGRHERTLRLQPGAAESVGVRWCRFGDL